MRLKVKRIKQQRGKYRGLALKVAGNFSEVTVV